MTDQSGRPEVALFSLGGTIASTEIDSPNAGVTPRLDSHELLASVPSLGEVARVSAVSFRRVPSGDLTWADVVALAREVDLVLADGAAGAVVTQGTDTIEETSFALDLLVRSDRPVVVTGAMRHPGALSADGPANILAAVRVAASRDATGLGTLVVLNDEIHAARFVRKTHSTSLATFQSPSAGPLGWTSEGRVRIVTRVSRLAEVAPVTLDVAPVALLTCSLGDDLRVLRELESLGYAGLVLQGFGGGHVPAGVVATIEELATRMPVVLASRTGSGELLRETYGFAGSESDVLARGALSAGALDGRKARVVVSVALAGGGDLVAVRDRVESVVRSVTAS